METALSLLLGISIKVYDDILDLGIQFPELGKEFLKAFMIFCFTLLAFNDFLFSLTVFLAFLGNSLSGGIDDPFWIAFAGIALLMTFFSISKPEYILNSLAFFVMFMTGIMLEPKFFPEETSTRKSWSRVIFILGSLSHTINPYFKHVPFVRKVANFVAAYFATSLAIVYLNKTEETKVKVEPLKAEVEAEPPKVVAEPVKEEEKAELKFEESQSLPV
jgi:hypothetical protein